MSMESNGGIILTEQNRRTQRKTRPSDTLSTTNPTQTDLGANPGICGERPVTRLLSRGTDKCVVHSASCHRQTPRKVSILSNAPCFKKGRDFQVLRPEHLTFAVLPIVL